MARTKQTAKISVGGRPPKRQLAVRAGYAEASMARAMARKWKVAYLRDRVGTGADIKYTVVWKTRVGGQRPETDEPATKLREDGFGDAMAIVDEWVDAGREGDFLVWARTHHEAVLGANINGSCMFEALAKAAVLEGSPSAVPSEEVERFQEGAAARGVDISRGISWKQTCAFLNQLQRAGSPLSVPDFKFNYQQSGHRGAAAIRRLKLKNGVYVVGAQSTMGVGHAFALHVSGRKLTVHDGDAKKTLGRYGEWIDAVMFVRKVVIQA
ncbi:hypothetical protein ON010_g6672 [Phytophthora cinnamomi]|nr:hypothetical protein ON010_g6672 [Phytophthora cinnamomi]